MWFVTLIQKVDFVNTRSNSGTNVQLFLTAHPLGCAVVGIKGTPLMLVKVEGRLDATTREKLHCPSCLWKLSFNFH